MLDGRVWEVDRLGNDAADEKADFRRRRVGNLVIDASRNLSGVCGRSYPVILDLHRFFIAISRALVNHDGRDGTASDPLAWPAGAHPKRRRLVHAVRDRAFLPGPPGIWDSEWVNVSASAICAKDIAQWPYTPGLLIKWVSFVGGISRSGQVGALIQQQAGRKFLFEHPAYASSWSTEVSSFVAGLEGLIHVTVDMCALGMADVDQHLHCKMTTLMTNDPAVADVFRPCRNGCDHEHFTFDEGRRTRRARKYPGQFGEVMATVAKVAVLRRDRSAMVQSMTLAVDEDDETADDGRDAESGFDEDNAPAHDPQPTESQVKMAEQYHRNLGHPSRREFLKVLKAAHTKPAVLEYVRRGYRIVDCDVHSRPQSPRKAAVPRTYEFNRIIALDVFYNHSGTELICHGTNFQVAALM